MSLWKFFIYVYTCISLCSELSFADQKVQAKDPSKFSIYIDAGSSGSRLGVYTLEPRANSIYIREIADKSTTSGIGIHSFAKETQKIGAYLEPLFAYAEEVIGSKNLEYVPVYLYATGGMRSISVKDQNTILKETELYLKNTKKFKKTQLKVLQGDEEGLFAWLTVNYLMGKLGEAATSKTTGVVDVGGATLQLAFEIDPTKLKNSKYVLNFNIGKRYYYVYVHSYPKFGQNTLLKDNMSLQKACLEKYYTAETLKDRNAKCQKEVENIFREKCADLQNCGLENISQPKLTGDFIGIGGMVYFSREVKTPYFTRDILEKTASKICSMDEKQISKEYTVGLVDDMTAMCFRSKYYQAMLYGNQEANALYNGFGFAPDEKIEIPTEINGHKSFSWMIGAVYFNSVIK